MDAQGRNRLIEKHLEVFKHAALYARAVDVDEAIQVGVLKVLERFHHYDHTRPFDKWAFVVAVTAIRDQYQPRTFCSDDVLKVVPGPDDPERVFLRNESAERIAARLTSLPPDLREWAERRIFADNPEVGPAKRIRTERMRAAKLALAADCLEAEPPRRPKFRAGSAARTRKWWANLSPERKAERYAREKARTKHRRGRVDAEGT